MIVERILGAGAGVIYLLAMCLPSIAHGPYVFRGWEAAYLSGAFSFAGSMDFVDRIPFIAGTLFNLLFLFVLTVSLGRVFWRWSWPNYFVVRSISAICVILAIGSVAFAANSHETLLVGAYPWVLSSVLLLAASFSKSFK